MDELSDAGLVELAQAGDEQAFAVLHARHFSAIYDFAARMTRNRDDAAAVARDTFDTAMSALGGLRRGVSFRAWLFAIARNRVLVALSDDPAARPAGFETADSGPGFEAIDRRRLASASEEPEAERLAPLAWAAAAALDARQLSLLDLHLRQDLGIGEIAELMGVTKKNSDVLLARLKRTAGENMAAFMAAHGARAGALSPLAVFAALAPMAAPDGLEAETLGELLGRWPGPAAMVPASAGFLAAKADEHTAGPLFVVLGVLAAALLVLLLVPLSPIALTRNDGQDLVKAEGKDPRATAGGLTSPLAPTRTATPSKPSASPTPSPGRSTPAPTLTSDAQVAGGASATHTPTPAMDTPTPSATLAQTPSPTNTPAPATTTPTGTAAPCKPSIGTAGITNLTVVIGGRSNFPLFNQAFCAGVAFSATVGEGAPWLVLGSTGATIAAGRSAEIDVSVNEAAVPATEGTYAAQLILTGPNNSVTVTVSTQRGGQAPLITSHTASCSAPGTAVSFQAFVIDDISVASVSVRYTLTDGQGASQEMTQSGGSWSASFNVSAAMTGYSIVATDGAGHQSAAVSGTCA